MWENACWCIAPFRGDWRATKLKWGGRVGLFEMRPRISKDEMPAFQYWLSLATESKEQARECDSACWKAGLGLFWNSSLSQRKKTRMPKQDRSFPQLLLFPDMGRLQWFLSLNKIIRTTHTKRLVTLDPKWHDIFFNNVLSHELFCFNISRCGFCCLGCKTVVQKCPAVLCMAGSCLLTTLLTTLYYLLPNSGTRQRCTSQHRTKECPQ